MTCHACSSAAKYGAKFCPDCGEPLRGALFCGPATGTSWTLPAGSDARKAAAPPAARSERRPLTVLFCDLVDSTELSIKIHEEVLRHLVERYYDVCEKIVARYQGEVAQYLGDGVLVYFGYPIVHEDDAERAIRSGLAILQELQDEEFRLLGAGQSSLRARIGVHSGQVVVGNLGRGAKRAGIALGQTVNLAYRLQTAAQPGEIIISGSTLRLLRGRFVTQDAGSRKLKGFARRINLYRVLHASGVGSHFDLARDQLTPFIGRKPEMAELEEHWANVKTGQGRAISITGEAGSGKSRLIWEFRERLGEERFTWLECRNSSFDRNEPYLAVRRLLERALNLHADEDSGIRLRKIEQALALRGAVCSADAKVVFGLLDPRAEDSAEELPNVARRRRLHAILIEWLLALSARQPVVLAVEDLHWADPSTIELLERLVAQMRQRKILLLITTRSEKKGSTLLAERCLWIRLSNLSPLHARRIVRCIDNAARIPDRTAKFIVNSADGVPLFVEEITRTFLESDRMSALSPEIAEAAEAAHPPVPSTLAAPLMSRLDGLGEQARVVAQLASVIGRSFHLDLLQALAQADEQLIEDGLKKLTDAGLVYLTTRKNSVRSSRYSFKHALVQEMAYRSIPDQRRRTLHADLADLLPMHAPRESQRLPSMIARHLIAGGRGTEAIPQLIEAAEAANDRAAFHEALAYVAQALEQVEKLPETSENGALEFDLLMAYAVAGSPIKGYAHPDIAGKVQRAVELAERIDDEERILNSLLFECISILTQGYPERALPTGMRAHDLCIRRENVALECLNLVQIGMIYLFMGDFRRSLKLLDQAIGKYGEGLPVSRGLASVFRSSARFGWRAWNLWFLGFPDQAVAQAEEAECFSKKVGDPNGIGLALMHKALLFYLLRMHEQQIRTGAELKLLGEENSFPMLAGLGCIVEGHGQSMLGDAHAAAKASAGAQQNAATGNMLALPLLMAIMAELQEAQRLIAPALGMVRAAIATGERTSQRFYQSGLLIHQARLQRQLGAPPPGLALLLGQAMETAQRQKAKAMELRACLELFDLQANTGLPLTATADLERLVSEFTEGWETPDLSRARNLLSA